MTLAPPRVPQTTAPVGRRTPPWWRASSRDLAVGSLVLVAGLWLRAGGAGALADGWAAATTSAGRLLGLVASDLLLLQVLLMARLPFLERAWGQDELARLHRLVGFWSFDLVLAHIALVTLGYAGADHANPAVELWRLVRDEPGMLLAAAGTLLLVLVVVTSVRRARRRLRYESWHLLHLYAYLGVGLALPHQLWTGQDLAANGLATAYWWTAWASTAAAVVVWRLGVPLLRTLRHRLVVERVVVEAPGVVSLHLRGRRLDELRVRAGQFFTFRFLDGPGSSRAHPFSLSAAPRPTQLRITAKDLGDGSARLARLRPGTRVVVEGPYGRLTAEHRTTRGVLLLGAGIGITPLRALAEEMPQEPGDVVLVHRVRSPDEAVFAGELEQLARRRGTRVVHLTGPRGAGWAPASLRLDDVAALRAVVPDVAERTVWVCGPDEWTAAALAAARAAGVPEERLHAERFTW